MQRFYNVKTTSRLVAVKYIFLVNTNTMHISFYVRPLGACAAIYIGFDVLVDTHLLIEIAENF